MCLYGIGIEYKDLFHILSTNVKGTSAFIIEDETAIQIGSQNFGLWNCIKSIDKSVLGISIRREKTCLLLKD
jgi:hypothetical protein